MIKSIAEYQLFVNELRVLCNKHNMILVPNEFFSQDDFVIEIHDADTTQIDVPNNTVMIVDGVPVVTSIGDIILTFN